MKQIAFLSADDLEGYVIDDHLSFASLRELGVHVETISWRKAGVAWDRFDCVIIRSTWDYQKHLPAFLATLQQIANATQLLNPLSIVRWNADKTYLRDLEKRGARIVPTLWSEGGIEPGQGEQWFAQLAAPELVIKPTVSANAQDSWRITSPALDPVLGPTFAQRPYMVQPFMNAIVEEGEYSLFYFDGEYSHAILKTPKPRDFRVQEEHGGLIRATEPSPELLRAGEKVMRLIDQRLLYARVDFVRDGDDFALMELELIEPSLYLRTNADVPARFAAAIQRWVC